MGTSRAENLLYFAVDGVTKRDLLREKKMKVTVNDAEIALFAHNGMIYAIQESCPHQGGPLHEAEIEELPDKSLCVKCPWHSWKFSLTNGTCLFPAKRDKTALVYPVKVDKEKIMIGFDHIAPRLFSTPPD
ncbi:unnamed protein product [Allacma fusca]|uniref:Rieske domain-containing protein n=1 Tax=Allacma fusca TaxID=39272 RepID=A0A8J2JSL6_9HEXA|nr:unnamed protein product [Allacma fusca]